MRFKQNIGRQLEQTVAPLQEQEDFVHLLLDSTAEAIVGIDGEGVFTFCNAACVNMLGYGGA